MTQVMTELPAGVAELSHALVDGGLLVRTSVDGVHLRAEPFEAIVRAVEALAHRAGGSATVPASEPLLHLPPVMPRETFVRTDYLRSFPDLIGSIHSFRGGDAEHAELLRLVDEGGEWTAQLEPAAVILSSAACHSVYAGLTGTLSPRGRLLEVQGTCFRHEPSPEPWRMQSFRMHEFLRVGSPSDTLTHRDDWLERGLAVLSGLGLPVQQEVANDPFFGRAGRMLARSQRGAELKWEIICPVTAADAPIAIGSANYHQEHFGELFDIRTPDGEPAHSACFAFGLERIAIALFATHGTDAAAWPAGVREQLRL